MLPANTLKQKLQAGQRVIGTWSMLPSANVVNVLGTTGLDFVIMDMEHGPMSFETVEQMVRAAQVTGCAPVVRVAEGSAATVLRALEVGSQGVLVPHVETPQAAREVVRACKYHPEGARGLSPYTRTHDYSHERLEESLRRTNAQTFIGILVEGQEGVQRLDEIAAVPGLDLVYLGVYDISQSVGVPGQLRHAKVMDAIQTCASRLGQRGVAMGSFAPDIEYAKLLVQAGCRFIAYSVDCAAMREYYRASVGALGSALGQ